MCNCRSVRPHPNILPIFGYYREGEKFNLVMEFQGGGNLYQMLKTDPNNAAFSNYRLITLVHGIASGLEMLHSMNIVHRDIAARNILVSFISKLGKFELLFKYLRLLIRPYYYIDERLWSSKSLGKLRLRITSTIYPNSN